MEFSKMYPRLYDEAYPSTVQCPQKEYNEDTIRRAFERICPSIAIIKNVRVFVANEQPYCRWLVEYFHQDLPPPGDSLKKFTRAVTKLAPLNTNIISQHYGHTSIFVIYEVTCSCEAPVNFVKATYPPNKWPILEADFDCVCNTLEPCN